MEQRRQVVREYVGRGLKLATCLEVAQMTKSSYYYKRNYTTGGAKKSKQTLLDGELVDDSQVIEEIKSILSEEFIDYGYRKIKVELVDKGYVIGKKKTYRLMKETGLLNEPKVKKNTFDKEIIKGKPNAQRPLEIIEIDIKYIYIDKDQRNAYLITIFDVFHREAYNWTLNYSMRTSKLIKLILTFVDTHIIGQNVEVSDLSISFRTDNGGQFVSKAYRELMQQFSFKNVYIPPATPQLNGHIESFHSTIEKLVCEKFEFQSLEDAQEVIARFMNTYNERRILNCLLDTAPGTFKALWGAGLVEKKEVKKNKYKFFFKEGDRKQNLGVISKMSPSFEVNLTESQDFCISHHKDIVNLPKQIYAT